MKLFYGRRISKKIKKEDLDELYKSNIYANKINLKKKIDYIVNEFNTINLEIGFGTGENLLAQSNKNLKEAFIGCDPFLNGNLNVFKNIKYPLQNNVLVTDLDFDSFFGEVLGKIKFSKIFIFFPDPWHKRRHNKRRLINKIFLEKLKNILKIGGQVFISTDCNQYYENIVKIFKDDICFKKVNFFKFFGNNTNCFEENYFLDTKYYRKSKNNLIDPKLVSYKLKKIFN